MPLAVVEAGATAANCGRTVALIGSHRREGTTTLAMALASTFEQGLARSVALIDLNLIAPRLHELNGLPLEPGIVDVLRGDVPLRGALNVAQTGNFAVLTAGRPMPGDVAMLISPGRLRRLLEQIRSQGFEFSVLDCPAILDSPDAALLAAQADSTYLVVQAERTKWDALRKSTAFLSGGGAELRGSILNRYRSHLPRMLDRRA